MKNRIDPADIRVGDLIRIENDTSTTLHLYTAMEYFARADGSNDSSPGTYYLLDRPFKPTWGMVISPTKDIEMYTAVYLPNGSILDDDLPWLTANGWESNAWAKSCLNDGWVILKESDVF